MSMTDPVVCETKIDYSSFLFEWRIDNFLDHLTKVDDHLESLSFRAGSHHWCLSARRLSKGNEHWLGIYLQLKNDGEVKADYTISLVPVCSEQTSLKKSANRTLFNELEPSWGFEFISIHDLSGGTKEYLDEINGRLTIRVEGRVFGEAESEFINDREELVLTKLHLLDTLSYDLGSKLLEGSIFSDFTIKAENKEFRVHKSILAARSDFFAALFASGMRETTMNEIVVEDIGAEVLAQLIRFLYTGKVRKIKGLELELFQAADKYQVAGLKNVAERALCVTLTTENAFELLVFADRHSAALLKAKTMEFISRKRVEVVKSKGWRQLHAQHPHLVAGLFTSMVMERKRRASEMSENDDDDDDDL